MLNANYHRRYNFSDLVCDALHPTPVIIRLVRNCALGRMIQYAATAVKMARPRRTGCPACAGHDGGCHKDKSAGGMISGGLFLSMLGRFTPSYSPSPLLP